MQKEKSCEHIAARKIRNVCVCVFCSFVCLLVDEWRRHSLMSKISWIIRREISSFPMHYPIEICSVSMPDKSEVLLSK